MKKINENEIFDFFNSDKTAGSYLKIDDLVKIGLLPSDSKLQSKKSDFGELIHESDFRKFWYKENTTKISFDEIIISKLILQSFSDTKIEQQSKVGKYKMDLLVEINGVKKYIEFDGPSHYVIGRFGIPKHPFDKKKTVEDITGIEVINWSYWIQRSIHNVKAIFDKNIEGQGCLWSTKTFFGSFCFNDSDKIIIQIMERFNAIKNGVGYIYEENTNGVKKIEHPIIENILNNKCSNKLLLPNGYKDIEFWLPNKLLK